jgi:hypothetical protein
MNNIFSYNNYKNFLIDAKRKVSIFPFSELENRGIVLRHDVDFDLNKAYKLHKLELDVGVFSSFFILTTSEQYNVFSKQNREILREMSNNGYDIGLHFDPRVYSNQSFDSLSQKVKVEAELLGSIIEKKVTSLSMHNPSITGRTDCFNGFINTYDSKYFNSEYYCSDSCKDFRGKNIYEFIEIGTGKLIQLLFHPIHFSSSGEESYCESFEKIFRVKINDFDQELRKNKLYSMEIEGTDLLNIIKENRDV